MWKSKEREREWRRAFRSQPKQKAFLAAKKRRRRAEIPAVKQQEKATARRYYLRNAAEVKAKNGQRTHLARYGITPEDRDAMFGAQRGWCACCFEPMERGAVDHNHVTGQVRAIVCAGCNRAVAALEGGYWRLKLALAYLLRYDKKPQPHIAEVLALLGEGDKTEPLP